MTASIRPRREEDVPDLAAVLVRVYELDGYPVEGVADPEGGLRHPNELQSWTAIDGDERIGQITLTSATPDDDAARAWREKTGGDIDRLAIPVRLFVDTGHRGSGAGRLLMEAAVDFARSQGLAIAFDVMLKDQAAIRLYERLGAERIAQITHHYGSGQTEEAAVYSIPSKDQDIPLEGESSKLEDSDKPTVNDSLLGTIFGQEISGISNAWQSAVPRLNFGLYRNIFDPVSTLPTWDQKLFSGFARSTQLFAAALPRVPKYDFAALTSLNALVDPLLLMRAAWLDSYDFSGFRSFLVEFAANLKNFQLPPNLASISGVSFESIATVVEDGIPLYRVPRKSIAASLLSAPDGVARRAILGRNFAKILDDCDDTLDLCVDSETRDGVLFTRSAISAARAGHCEAAQALAANTLDTLISTQLSTRSDVTRKHFKGHAWIEREELDDLQVRWFLVALPIWHAHRKFSGGTTGSGIPRNYNRHATVHGVSRRQFSKRNTLTALMANTAFVARLNDL